jgi:hydrogenase maturation factor HypF (carbamoyltransferase family)
MSRVAICKDCDNKFMAPCDEDGYVDQERCPPCQDAYDLWEDDQARSA